MTHIASKHGKLMRRAVCPNGGVCFGNESSVRTEFAPMKLMHVVAVSVLASLLAGCASHRPVTYHTPPVYRDDPISASRYETPAPVYGSVRDSSDRDLALAVRNQFGRYGDLSGHLPNIDQPAACEAALLRHFERVHPPGTPKERTPCIPTCRSNARAACCKSRSPARTTACPTAWRPHARHC